MYKIIILLLIILNPIIGRCDHAPFWHLSLNGLKIYDSREDSFSEDNLFHLDLSTIELTDSTVLVISYKTDIGESGENHLIFKNSVNDILLDISATDRASFTLTRKEIDIINCDAKIDVLYYPSWAKLVEFDCEQKLMEIN